MSTRAGPHFPWLDVAALCLACFFAGFLLAASLARHVRAAAAAARHAEIAPDGA